MQNAELGIRKVFRAHEYQEAAVEHILGHPFCALFLDMGLGKTVITLTALRYLFDLGEIRRVLVSAPVRVARDTWPAEAEKWAHLSGLRVASATGTAEQRKQALNSDANVVCIGRENLPWLIENGGERMGFDCLVLDELSSFKNYQAKRYKAMQKLRRWACRVIGLTGTPSSNGLEDLWAEMRLIDGGERLGTSIGRFRQAWLEPDKRNGMQIYSYKSKRGAEEACGKLIADITLTMRAVEKLKMPELISTVVKVKLDKAERAKYTELRDEMVLGEEVTAANAAVLAGKLAQLGGGALYTDEGKVLTVHCRKLDALEDILESAQGQSVLVAYWYKHELERIEERLKALGYDFQRIDKPGAIAAWNAGKVRVGLIHPASAGHGLNLQAGGRQLVWFSLTWSLELYQQTNARLWRQGQQAGTVVIQHICTEGTIDGRILAALSRKDCGQSALMEAVKAEFRMQNEESGDRNLWQR